MNQDKKLIHAIKITRHILDDIMFMVRTRTKPTYFTRKSCKMGFVDLILFTFSFVKKSLPIELNRFLTHLKAVK